MWEWKCVRLAIRGVCEDDAVERVVRNCEKVKCRYGEFGRVNGCGTPGGGV